MVLGPPCPSVRHAPRDERRAVGGLHAYAKHASEDFGLLLPLLLVPPLAELPLALDRPAARHVNLSQLDLQSHLAEPLEVLRHAIVVAPVEGEMSLKANAVNGGTPCPQLLDNVKYGVGLALHPAPGALGAEVVVEEAGGLLEAAGLVLGHAMQHLQVVGELLVQHALAPLGVLRRALLGLLQGLVGYVPRLHAWLGVSLDGVLGELDEQVAELFLRQRVDPAGCGRVPGDGVVAIVLPLLLGQVQQRVALLPVVTLILDLHDLSHLALRLGHNHVELSSGDVPVLLEVVLVVDRHRTAEEEVLAPRYVPKGPRLAPADGLLGKHALPVAHLVDSGHLGNAAVRQQRRQKGEDHT
mmetsp:Transcript_22770/g.56196  ORF Transcript_22770/g.56196 Transcript_22770/m.56196 type:complete len:355 (-) Transcript_22770:83-1147(-)